MFWITPVNSELWREMAGWRHVMRCCQVNGRVRTLLAPSRMGWWFHPLLNPSKMGRWFVQSNDTPRGPVEVGRPDVRRK